MMENKEKSVNDIMQEMENDFNIFSKQAENFINKYGNPHKKIIISLDGIEIVEGVKAKEFKIND